MENTDVTEELQNQNPEFVVSLYGFITDFFSNYGWFLLIGTIICVYIYNKILRTSLQNYWKKKSEDEYSAKYHKNPDLLLSRMSAMEETRQKMQEKYNKEVEEFKVKQTLKEEKKRQEWLERHGAGNASSSGTKLGYGKKIDSEDKKKSLRTDYNPLMGGASGSSYRAPKRSACGGGGCG